MRIDDLPPLGRAVFAKGGCLGVPLLILRCIQGSDADLEACVRLFMASRHVASIVSYDSHTPGTAATIITDLQAFVTTPRVDITDDVDARRTVVVRNFHDLPEATRITFARLIEVASMFTLFVFTTTTSVLDVRLASRAVVVAIVPSATVPPTESLRLEASALLDAVTTAARVPACHQPLPSSDALPRPPSRSVVMLARCVARCASGPALEKSGRATAVAMAPRAWLRVIGMAAIDKAGTDADRLRIVVALQEADHACAMIMQSHDVHATRATTADTAGQDTQVVVSLDAAHARVAQRSIVERFVVEWCSIG